MFIYVPRAPEPLKKKKWIELQEIKSVPRAKPESQEMKGFIPWAMRGSELRLFDSLVGTEEDRGVEEVVLSPRHSCSR